MQSHRFGTETVEFGPGWSGKTRRLGGAEPIVGAWCRNIVLAFGSPPSSIPSIRWRLRPSSVILAETLRRHEFRYLKKLCTAIVSRQAMTVGFTTARQTGVRS